MEPAIRAGLLLKTDGGKVQFFAAASAAARSIVGPSEFVIQTLPFSSTIANTRTVPTTLWLFAMDGYLGETRFVSRPLSEPALTSCGSAVIVAAGAGAGVVGVGAGVGSGFAVNGLGSLLVTASRAWERPRAIVWNGEEAIFSLAVRYSVCHFARSSSFLAIWSRVPSTSSIKASES